MYSKNHHINEVNRLIRGFSDGNIFKTKVDEYFVENDIVNHQKDEILFEIMNINHSTISYFAEIVIIPEVLQQKPELFFKYRLVIENYQKQLLNQCRKDFFKLSFFINLISIAHEVESAGINSEDLQKLLIKLKESEFSPEEIIFAVGYMSIYIYHNFQPHDSLADNLFLRKCIKLHKHPLHDFPFEEFLIKISSEKIEFQILENMNITDSLTIKSLRYAQALIKELVLNEKTPVFTDEENVSICLRSIADNDSNTKCFLFTWLQQKDVNLSKNAKIISFFNSRIKSVVESLTEENISDLIELFLDFITICEEETFHQITDLIIKMYSVIPDPVKGNIFVKTFRKGFDPLTSRSKDYESIYSGMSFKLFQRLSTNMNQEMVLDLYIITLLSPRRFFNDFITKIFQESNGKSIKESFVQILESYPVIQNFLSLPILKNGDLFIKDLVLKSKLNYLPLTKRRDSIKWFIQKLTLPNIDLFDIERTSMEDEIHLQFYTNVYSDIFGKFDETRVLLPIFQSICQMKKSLATFDHELLLFVILTSQITKSQERKIWTQTISDFISDLDETAITSKTVLMLLQDLSFGQESIKSMSLSKLFCCNQELNVIIGERNFYKLVSYAIKNTSQNQSGDNMPLEFSNEQKSFVALTIIRLFYEFPENHDLCVLLPAVCTLKRFLSQLDLEKVCQYFDSLHIDTKKVSLLLLDNK